LCGITSVAFSVSGRLLFAGYDDFECKVHIFPANLSQRNSRRLTPTHRSGTFSVAKRLDRYKGTTIASVV
jgi:hypothetical protein